MNRSVSGMVAVIAWGFGLLAAGCAAPQSASGAAGSEPRPTIKPLARTVISFDRDWRFSLGDVPDAQAEAFDDAAWRKLDLPHDWSIEGAIDQKNPTGGAGAWMPSGVAWYRKGFVLPPEASGRKITIEFDGVMEHSDVWVNGVHLGNRPNGYVSFVYDLTPHVKFGGGANVIAVRTDTSKQPASRWYTGAGIYRHVRLVTKDPVHLETWGTLVSTPDAGPEKATVRVQSEAVNASSTGEDVSLHVELVSPEGKVVGSTDSPAKRIEPGKTIELSHELTIERPTLWDFGAGNLYVANIQLRKGGKVRDDEPVKFGVRAFSFEPDKGFVLNGKNPKILGVCLHHDASALGAAVPMSVWERRLSRLREMGVNGIRTAHNPPDPAFLDLCDRMGFVVMDEMFDCWRVGKNPFDYHLEFDKWSLIDTRDTVRRDRNHPSIVLYSAGNEIHDTPRAEAAKEILSGLVKVFHENDPTRPVTQALFRPNVSRDYYNGLADLLDVVGQNYRENELVAAATQKPTRKIIGTENGHTRGAWVALREDPRMAGQFLWTGIDYLGESRTWPLITNASFGLLDRTGMTKPMGFERQSWWASEPMVHATRRVAASAPQAVDPGYENQTPPPTAGAATSATSPSNSGTTTAPATVPTSRPANRRQPGGGGGGRREQVLFSDWTPRSAEAHNETVEVYSNCPDVELVLNGKSLGSKPRPKDDSARVWTVTYEPGTLSAIGSKDGTVFATHELRTAGKAAALRLGVDRKSLINDWEDVASVEVSVVDENGTVVPSASETIGFDVTGAGALVAVDSADNRSHESFRGRERKAFQGRCLAVVRATSDTGSVTLTITAPGLAPATVTIPVTGAAAK